MKLSKNLKLSEAVKSITAERLGIDNTPNDQEINNLKSIAENIFQPIRDHFGVPIGISSGFRCKKLNAAIGGSKTSQHMSGSALDIDADMYGKITNKQVFDYIRENLDFDQLIWEFGNDENPSWVHVSYQHNDENRKRVLKAYRLNGETRYKVI
jgi:zinc D-Ala-D-Ala carboxypeptidase